MNVSYYNYVISYFFYKSCLSIYHPILAYDPMVLDGLGWIEIHYLVYHDFMNNQLF